MKQRKSYVILLLLLGLFFLLPGTRAAASDADISKTGLTPPTLKKMDSLNQSDLYQSKRSAATTSEWEQYGSYYYYNQMTSKEQAFYDRLNSMCLSYLEGTINAKTYYYEYDWVPLTSFCGATGLSEDDAYDTAMVFFYSNPQYYFLSPTFYSKYSKNTTYIAIQIYDSLADGQARKKKTASMKAKIASYVAIIQKEKTVLAKEKKAHDLIVNQVTYESSKYDQSAYSTFLQGKTVCAGYAAAFAILCNAVGIDTAVVTSYDHAWNYVRLNDSWYYVDCTWDDTDDTKKDNAIYTFFNRSKEKLLAESGNKQSHHKEDSLWKGYTPICTLDSGATKHRVGTIYTPQKKTSTPSISVTYKNGYNTISIKGAPSNAVIYYTTDGSTPTVAKEKALTYHSSFKVTASNTIKAIAVTNTYFDSAVSSSSQIVTLLSAYTPMISKQPASDSYYYKTTPTALTVKAKVTDGGTLSYQWYQATTPDTSNGTPIKKATSASYTPSTSTIGTMYYYCVIKNTNPNAAKKTTASITTSAAKLVTTKRAIKKASVSKVSAETYCEKAVKPTPAVKWNGSKLKLDTDYTLSYSANKAIGTATITITGKGIYSGSKTVTFSIVPKPVTIKSVSGKTKAVTIRWKSDRTISGYTIQYSLTKSFSSSKTITVKKASASSQTIAKLKARRGYYIRIRSYKTVKKKTYYSSWSKASYVKTK